MSSVRYRILHRTSYTYAADVVHAHQLLHLVPRPARYQECREHAISVAPAYSRKLGEIDAFGNLVTRVEFDRPHRYLEVVSEMQVEVHPRPVVAASDTMPWEQLAAELDYRGVGPAREHLDACRYRHESPHVRIKRMFTEYGAECFAPNRPILACAAALMSKIHDELAYAPGETTVSTPLAEVLASRKGVCQDFSHLMIACLRSRGLAARYVSGYVRLSPVRIGASHAWVAVYAPPFGWVELDPTNDTFVGTDHVAVAYGRDFGDVSPLRGVIVGGGSHRLEVSVIVESIAAPAF
jgi:transglutaminase-like putative cysteine protease